MATVNLEELQQRLANLEAEVAELKARTTSKEAGDWRSTIGMFTGNEVMRAIDAAALAYREEDRRATRPAE
jgi:hypothetical protein